MIKDTSGMAEAIRDSLQKLYASSVNEMGETIDSAFANRDSLQGRLHIRLTAISKLQNEINRILSNKNITKEELKAAKSKIRELQALIDQLIIESTSSEKERKKLNGELNQLSEEVKEFHADFSSLDSKNEEIKKMVIPASTLVASELRLTMVDAKTSPGTETETSEAKSANKVVVSFMAQNNVAEFSNTEIYVVLSEPDGTVITNEIWDSGTFDTKKEHGKLFTRKIKFDYIQGEKKPLTFSLDYDKFIKGIYRIRLYHNGLLIGETTKTLS
ncbi:MAG: hypothetical protein JWM28_681 [Chitinophagaceae bacterium]|nr:hypothetical protein [Chitinophagaceae bacterium]